MPDEAVVRIVLEDRGSQTLPGSSSTPAPSTAPNPIYEPAAQSVQSLADKTDYTDAHFDHAEFTGTVGLGDEKGFFGKIFSGIADTAKSIVNKAIIEPLSKELIDPIIDAATDAVYRGFKPTVDVLSKQLVEPVVGGINSIGDVLEDFGKKGAQEIDQALEATIAGSKNPADAARSLVVDAVLAVRKSIDEILKILAGIHEVFKESRAASKTMHAAAEKPAGKPKVPVLTLAQDPAKVPILTLVEDALGAGVSGAAGTAQRLAGKALGKAPRVIGKAAGLGMRAFGSVARLAGKAFKAAPILTSVLGGAGLLYMADKAFKDVLKADMLGPITKWAASADASVSKPIEAVGDALSKFGEKIPFVGSIIMFFGEKVKLAGELIEALNQTAQRYSEFSPQIAQAQAFAEIRHTLGDMRRSQEISATMSKYIAAQSDLQQKFEDIKIKLLVKIIPIVTHIMEVIDAIMPSGEGIENALNFIGEAIQALVMPINLIMGSQKEIADAARPDIPDPANQLFDDAFRKTTDVGGWVPNR